jgi:hypothetical protein
MKTTTDLTIRVIEGAAQVLIAATASFCLLVIGEREPISELIQIPGFGRYWLKNFGICWALILLVRYHYHWLQNRKQQALWWVIGIIGILLLCYGLSALYFYSEGVRFHRINYFNTLFPLSLAYILILSLSYMLLGKGIKELRQNAKENDQKSSLEIMLNHGDVFNCLPAAQIKRLQREGKVLLIQTFQGDLYTHDSSLKQLMEQLREEDNHFRINRSTIIHYASIKTVIQHDYRTLELFIENITPSYAVSQQNVNPFKAWLLSKNPQMNIIHVKHAENINSDDQSASPSSTSAQNE